MSPSSVPPLDRYAVELGDDVGERLVDYAESRRVGGWSLRSALVRFAQPQPTRASVVLELVRRTDAVLRPDRMPPSVADAAADDRFLAALDAAAELDGLGDTLATWATDITQPAPVGAVDAVCARVFQRLQAAGVPRETGPPPRGRR